MSTALIFRRWVDDGKPLDSLDNTQKTPLHYAAQWGQEETLDFLVECGANVNSADFIDDTPLHFVSPFPALDGPQMHFALINSKC